MSKTRLPVIGSSASSTAFVSERVDGLGGTYLYLDGNAKITAGNGTYEAPVANAFSLPAAGLSGMEHCPGSTPTCRKACYVENLRDAQPELYATYEHNAVQIREILDDEYLASDWCMRFAHHITQHCSGGFRLHVSGDVFSLEYAEWLADVVREAAPVQFWIYTRSFDLIAPLVAVSTLRGGNLALNLSADDDNYDSAIDAEFKIGRKTGREPRIAYLTVDGSLPLLMSGDIVFPDYRLRPRASASLVDSAWWQSITPAERKLVCPVDAHGKSEKSRCGPCSRCLT